MEEIVEIIKKNLTGNYEEDIEFLNSLYEEENKIIENANATIEAINIVVQEIEDEKEDNQVIDETKEDEVEENLNEESEEEEEELSEEELEARAKQEEEIDGMIDDLFTKMDEENHKDLLPDLENIITKIESLSNTSNEKEIHCSFSNDIERMIFEKIFAGDKKIVVTPYKNDVLYILYADMLLEKKRKTAALDALNRAIYWNFLNREAREKKLEILHSKNQIVKYLDNLKVLQQISYTTEDLAHVYNLYAKIFDELKDKKAAYGMYKISNYYYPSEEIEELIYTYEDANPEYKELTDADIINHLTDNEVQVGPSQKIIKAHREITTEFINEGRFEDAMIMLENDYSLTQDEQIANVYNQIVAVLEQEREEAKKETKRKTTRKKKDDAAEPEAEEAKEEPKKKTTRKKKTEEVDKAAEEKKTTKKSKTAASKDETKKTTKKATTKKDTAEKEKKTTSKKATKKTETTKKTKKSE